MVEASRGEDPASDVRWVHTASDGSEFVFHSHQEMREFFIAENERWSWVRDKEAATAGHTRAAVAEAINFKPAIVALNNHPADQGRDSIPIVQQTLDRYLGFVPALHSKATLQGFLWNIAQRDKPLAMAALCAVLQDSGVIRAVDADGMPVPKLIAGAMEAAFWKRGLTPDADALALVDRIRRLVSDGEFYKKELGDAAIQIGFLKDSIEKTEIGARESVATTLEKLSKAADETGKKVTEDLALLTKTYEDSLALQAPSLYWKIKSGEHRKAANWFAIASVLFGLAGAFLLWWMGRELFGDLTINKIPAWGQVVPMTVGVLLFLWGLKTLIRLTMSHIHLTLDSAERRVLVMSYLALSRRKEVTSEQTSALFAAIFRPSGDGIVKDESPPFAIAELLAAGSSRSKS